MLGGFGHTYGVGVNGDRVGVIYGDFARGDADHASLDDINLRDARPHRTKEEQLRCQVQVLVIVHNHSSYIDCTFTFAKINAPIMYMKTAPSNQAPDLRIQASHNPRETHDYNTLVVSLVTKAGFDSQTKAYRPRALCYGPF